MDVFRWAVDDARNTRDDQECDHDRGSTDDHRVTHGGFSE